LTNKKNNFIGTTCDSESGIIIQDFESIYNYDIQEDSNDILAKNVNGISGGLGYLGNDEILVTAANWDSVYYYIDTTWIFSGHSTIETSDLIHVGCGESTSYFMGQHLWFYNGVDAPRIIRFNIGYSVADLVVDENENA